MNAWRMSLTALLLWGSAQAAQAGGYVSFGFGYRGPVYRPYAYPHFHYQDRPAFYGPPPVVLVQPEPLYVEAPPTVIVRPAPSVVVPSYSAPVPQWSPPTPQPQITPTYSEPPQALPTPIVRASSFSAAPNGTTALLEKLSSGDDAGRKSAALELGRAKNVSAVDPLTATLTNDTNAGVRESAARALGMIGSPRAMNALQRSALSDNDSLVRHSSQFALDIIHANHKR